MIPPPSDASSGDPDPQTIPEPVVDWREELFAAVQQRDSQRAIILAQRCVHRYGIGTLDALLGEVDIAEGREGEARAWLHPLLSPAPSAPLMEPGPQPAAPAVPLSSPSPPPSSPASLPSASLDEAFAPLEIAFPPLPTVGGNPAEGIPPALDPVQESPLPLRSLLGEADHPLLQPADEPPEDALSLDEPQDDSEAAPVPRFDGDDVLEEQPSPRRRARRPSRGGTNSPAPISPALEPWLSWLHGGSRERS